MKHIGYETSDEYYRARQKSFATMRANLLALIREAEIMLRADAERTPAQRRASLHQRVAQCTSTLYLLANLDPASAVEPYQRLSALVGSELTMPSPFVEFLRSFDHRSAEQGNVVDLGAWRQRRSH